jgi:DNA mismatch repair protein MutS2
VGAILTPVLHLLRPDPCPWKTRVDLDWHRLLKAIGDRCAGPLGRVLAEDLPFAETRPQARTWMAESAEAHATMKAGQPLPLFELHGVREATDRARIGASLSPDELRDLGRMLDAARTLRRFLTPRKAELVALHQACATDPTLDAVADAILDCFEADGTLADRASPELGELRGAWRAMRQRMLARMEDLMQRHEAVLQDRFVTEREGRWVLPVRADAHERVAGIVHATSASGSTLFVEPRAVVPMGNRLKVLEAEVRREEEIVCARLSALIIDVLSSVEAACAALALADVRTAIARLASDLGLTFPTLLDDPHLDLKRARHPLLALDFLELVGPAPGARGAHVVPSDMGVEAGKAMVISGPNAGGKTVALKTMGLAALMARSGVPLPCDDGSSIGIFDVVLTDVGDDQNLQKNLSTFSAHVSNLASILEETASGALVLLDELAGGTDPREGEALAAGVIHALCRRGGAVAVTTHYEGLKTLALADPRFSNASVGLDLATMTPTFELAIGVPGRSSALAVAKRFGIPTTVIEDAERFLTREDHDFETVLKKLHDERAALALAREAAEAREREAEQTRARLDAELTAAKGRERRLLSEEAQSVMDRLRDAREDLRDVRARMRSRKIEAPALREAERTVERIAEELAIGGVLEPLVVLAATEQREMVSARDLRKGARVWVQRLRAEADVVEVLADGAVRVAAGPLKLTVASAELRAVLREAPRTKPGGRADARAGSHPPKLSAARSPSSVPMQVRANTCDLRGLRVDDGVSMATTFLDRALNDGQDVVFLLHGHGTGALREAIRGELQRTPYVARFQGEAADRGGDGVTVVWLM